MLYIITIARTESTVEVKSSMAHKVTHENHLLQNLFILSALRRRRQCCRQYRLYCLQNTNHNTVITFNGRFLVILLYKIKCVELVVNSAVKTAKL